MKEGRTWAALAVDYTSNPSVRRLGRQVGRMRACAYWPAVITACKAAGRSLVAEIDPIDFADRVGDEGDGRDVWTAMAGLELVQIVDGTITDEAFTIRLVNGAAWQVPAGTKRSRRSRAKSPSDATPGNGVQRDATQRNAYTDTDTDTETDTDTKTETDNAQDRAKRRGRRTPKVSAPTAEMVVSEIAECRATLNGCGDLVDRMAQLLAEKNATGKVAASRVLRELWRPLANKVTDGAVTRLQLRYGLERAIEKGVPNANWALRAAESYRPPAGAREPQPATTSTEEGAGTYDNGITWYDTDSTTDG